MLAAAGWVPLSDSEARRAKLAQTPEREGGGSGMPMVFSPPCSAASLRVAIFLFLEHLLCYVALRRNDKFANVGLD
jgi:hypothetical protein